MNNMTQTLALELAPHIRVNGVAPGPVVTEAFRDTLTDDPDKLAAIAASVPLGRTGTPDDIAGAVVYRTSVRPASMKAPLILVAGGRTHRAVGYAPEKDR